MKKKIVVMLLVSTMALTGCGKNTVEFEQSASVGTENTEQTQNSELVEEPASTVEDTEETQEESEEIDNSAPVSITLANVSMYDDINDYIAYLQSEDSDGEYTVYNDDYYTTTITEKEREDGLTQLSDKDFLDESFSSIFTDDQFAGAFVKMDYDDDLQNFTFYVNKQAYTDNEFVCDLGVGLITNMISDSYQAYNMIRPEDRITEIKILDNETGEDLTAE